MWRWSISQGRDIDHLFRTRKKNDNKLIDIKTEKVCEVSTGILNIINRVIKNTSIRNKTKYSTQAAGNISSTEAIAKTWGNQKQSRDKRIT